MFDDRNSRCRASCLPGSTIDHLSMAAQNRQTDEVELRPLVYSLPKASSELLASLSKVISSEAEAMWEFFWDVTRVRSESCRSGLGGRLPAPYNMVDPSFEFLESFAPLDSFHHRDVPRSHVALHGFVLLHRCIGPCCSSGQAHRCEPAYHEPNRIHCLERR